MSWGSIGCMCAENVRPLPFFVYGTLRESERASDLLNQFAKDRRKAIGRGKRMRISTPFPAVRFHPEGPEIRGELVWIENEHFDEVAQSLDSYEGVPEFFERVRVVVLSDQDKIEAYAYQWAQAAPLVREYISAAERKVRIARFHLDQLERLTDAAEVFGQHPSIEIQAHFEGILFAAVAAADQVAEATNIGLGLGLGNTSLVSALGAAPAHLKLRKKLFRWHNKPVAADYRVLRRLAIHHWSHKQPRGPLIEVERPDESRYEGARDLYSYGTAVVEHLAELEDLLLSIEAALTDEGSS